MNKIMGCMKNDINFLPEIPILVWKHADKHADSFPKYVSYLCSCNYELVQRTWAYKRVRGELKLVEVERKTPIEEYAVRRNIYFTQIGGYHPVFEPKTVPNKGYSYHGYSVALFDASSDWNKWYCEKEMGITTHIVNTEYLYEFEKYKYCGYSGAESLMHYLREYEKNPKVEYFGKMGIKYSKTLENKCKKDKQFINWLRQQNPIDVNMFGPCATILAYDKKISIAEARRWDADRRRIINSMHWWVPEFKGTKIDLFKLNDYLDLKVDGRRSYNDYLRAIKALGLDLKDTKNVFPEDFQRMHDLRINQYEALKAKEDKAKRAKLTKDFKKAAAVFAPFAIENDKYVLIMPGTPNDLVKEGNALHHCVGRMGYDRKMANGDCVIAFIRLKAEPDKPYVTVEYLTAKKVISQCYAEHDSRPVPEVLEFANKWAESINEGMKAV